MSDMPWVRFFPSDWLGGTRGMSAAETGIYITLIATMYERGEPIPEDHARLARLCGASNATFRASLETLISEGKITRVEGGLWNDRVEKENVYRSEKSEVGRQAAQVRWSGKDKKNNSATDASALQSHSDGNANQIPDTREEKELRSKKKNPRQILASVLPADDADAVVEHRQRIRKPLTARAAELLAAHLAAAPQTCGLSAQQAANLMIERGWTGFEPEWAKNARPNAAPQKPPDWERRLNHARHHGTWASSEWGPKPGMPGCQVPEHLLTSTDGAGWREWERAA